VAGEPSDAVMSGMRAAERGALPGGFFGSDREREKVSRAAGNFHEY